MSDYEQQLAAALQQLSQQHEQQLHDVLQQVSMLANEVTKLATLNQQQMQPKIDAHGSGSRDQINQKNHGNKASLLTIAALHYQEKMKIQEIPACLKCNNALFYISGGTVFFNCLISRLEHPVTSCSQLTEDEL